MKKKINKTKIVFVLPNMLGGGSERVVAILANEFVQRGYEVALLLFAGNQVVYPLDEKVEVFSAGQVSGGNPLLTLKRLFKMRKYYRQNNGCHIFSFSETAMFYSVLTTWGLSCKMLVSERNDPTKIEHQKMRNWAYNKADVMVCQTEDMKRYFSEELQKKIRVIPNPVSDNMPEPFKGERKKQIVSVARLQPQKNHKLLLDAFSVFSERFPEYELHIFGIGELEEELHLQAEQLGIDKKVYFRGFAKNVKEEIRDSAMFVLSSDYEGISNSMIEALAMGIPVVSTDCPVGGSAAYIKDGVSGLLVPVGDRKALTEAMIKIAQNPEVAEQLSQNAVKVKEEYHVRKIADRFLEAAGIE